MAQNKAKFNKFMTGAVTATMVATAIVPVAAAAEKSFSDVQPTDSHYKNINQAVERGLFNGYADGTFKPYTNMSRGGVAKVLANYVVKQEGLTYDSYLAKYNDKNTVVAFNDVTANHPDKELYKASLIVKHAGIFTGSNNNLLPKNNITRQQMAKVLVNGFGLQDLEGELSKVTDLDQAFTEYVPFIEILSENGVTEVEKFNPKAPVLRAQMASFLNRAYDVAEATISVVSATATSATTLDVRFSDGNTESYSLDEALEIGKATQVEVEYKGEKYTVSVTWAGQVLVTPGTVAFANQPAAKSLPRSSQLNEVYKFQVTAGADAITLRSLQLKQYGTALANEDDVTNVHLSVNGEIRATGTLNANNEVRLTRSLTIPANSTVEFTVLSDIAAGATPTATVQFGIESLNAFTANATLNGTFPNVGNAFNVVAGNIGNVTVTGNSSSYSVDTGDVEEELGKFTLQAGSEEGVNVKRITLTSNGFNADEIENLYLYANNGADKIPVQGVATKNEVVFDLTGHEVAIGRNQAKSFVVKGDPQEAVASGNFRIENAYDVVAQGANSGYNNGNSIATAGSQSLGQINVALGQPKFRVSTNTPKQGDKIVASTSEYGLVREYTLNPAGQDVTLKDATIQIDWKNASTTQLKDAVRTIELYDATSGSVIKTFDVPNTAAYGATGSVPNISLTGLNWAIDKSMNLQVRAVATADDVNVKEFDVLITNLNYDIRTSTGSKQNGNVAGPVLNPQFKEFTTNGGIEVTQPAASARVHGYSISGGLSQAQLGGFRVEAKDEALKVTDVKVKVDMIGNVSTLLSNPVLTYDGKVVAYGDIKDATGLIEFKFDNDFVIDAGSSNRKVLKLQADVLEGAAANETIGITLNQLKTRGVKSNIVSEGTGQTQNLIAGENGNANTLDYRSTSVSVNVSPEAIDTKASSNANVLKFTVTNLAPNDNADKAVTIDTIRFENLFNFPVATQFVLRDDKMKPFAGFLGATTATNTLTFGNGTQVIDGDDSEDFFLYGDLSIKASGSDVSEYKNVRMRLDVKPNTWVIKGANGQVIRPLLLNYEGPDVTITD